MEGGENFTQWSAPAPRVAAAPCAPPASIPASLASFASTAASTSEDGIEPYSGLAIKNRLIGRADVSSALHGRQVYRVTALASSDRGRLAETVAGVGNVLGHKGAAVKREGVSWVLAGCLAPRCRAPQRQRQTGRQ